MGSFGIQFSENFSRPQDVIETQDELNEKIDGFFQKSLAYSSYYIMLFVAYLMITPEKMALVQDAIMRLFV